MAYMNQERKAERAPAIKAILKKYGMKGSLSVRNYSSLVLTLKSGELDLIGFANKSNEEFAKRRGAIPSVVKGYYAINEYRDADDARNLGEETIANFIDEVVDAMLGKDYFNNDDAMTDYFHRSHYIDIKVGKWNKDYEYTGA